IPEAVGKGGIVVTDAYKISEWVAAIKRLDSKNFYSEYSKLAKKHARNFIFKKQWVRFSKTINRVKR
ncbi:hypothetical protein KY320_04330, partial [Candidatus Woesearchaeota archaeon]|nr:hypothetical protein [Candidatus Woesearchaeota archaeon]